MKNSYELPPPVLTGVGNALVDVFVDVGDDALVRSGLAKGSMTLVGPAEQDAYCRLGTVSGRAGGGSVANSVFTFARLGGSATFLGRVGEDENGRFYRDEFSRLGIGFPVPPAPGATGSALCLVTPDAERTMTTSLGVAGELSPADVAKAPPAAPGWVLLEGYLLANPDAGRAAVVRAAEVAARSGAAVAVTCSEAWVVSSFDEPLRGVIGLSAVVFMNEHEAAALTGAADPESAVAAARDLAPEVVVTAGARGAFVTGRAVPEPIHVPAFPCSPVDLTGAGDAFAGTYLFARSAGLGVAEAAARACRLSSEVIRSYGARIGGDVRGVFDSAA